MDQGDCVKTAFLQLGSDRIGIDGLAPFNLNLLGLLPAALRDVEPLVGEGPTAEIENLAADQVADGSLHHTPRRRGGEENRPRRAGDCLQSRLHGSVECFEILAAVPDHGRAHGFEGGGRNVDRSGNEEFRLRHGAKTLPRLRLLSSEIIRISGDP